MKKKRVSYVVAPVQREKNGNYATIWFSFVYKEMVLLKVLHNNWVSF